MKSVFNCVFKERFNKLKREKQKIRRSESGLRQNKKHKLSMAFLLYVIGETGMSRFPSSLRRRGKGIWTRMCLLHLNKIND
jgi:hypothetical protein